MTTQFNIGIDWRRKGVICWESQPEDALNILPQPIRYGTWNQSKVTRGEEAIGCLVAM